LIIKCFMNNLLAKHFSETLKGNTASNI
jgi:hypothetical protein